MLCLSLMYTVQKGFLVTRRIKTPVITFKLFLAQVFIFYKSLSLFWIGKPEIIITTYCMGFRPVIHVWTQWSVYHQAILSLQSHIQSFFRNIYCMGSCVNGSKAHFCKAIVLTNHYIFISTYSNVRLSFWCQESFN